MSLLLDALKKSEEARLSSQAGQSNHTDVVNTASAASVGTTPELTLEVLPQTSPSEPATAARKNAIEMEPVRVAGQNLFAAKVAPKQDKFKLGIIPIALISGLLLATGGGIYIWLETATPPAPQMPHRVAVVPIPPAVVTPETAAAVSNTPSANTGAPSGIATVIAKKSGSRAERQTAARAPSAAASATNAAPIQSLMFKPHTDSLSTMLAEAYRAYRAGDTATAADRYRAVLQQDAKNRDALLGMAAIAQQQQNDGLAIQYYSQVLALDPRDPAAYAAMSALNFSDPASAESRLKLLLEHRPNAAILHFALGNVYAEQARWGDAQQAYFNAVNREPENAQFNFNLAVSLDHLSQDKLAAQYYQRALQLDQSGQLDQAGLGNQGNQAGSANLNPSFNHSEAQQRLQQLTTP